MSQCTKRKLSLLQTVRERGNVCTLVVSNIFPTFSGAGDLSPAGGAAEAALFSSGHLIFTERKVNNGRLRCEQRMESIADNVLLSAGYAGPQGEAQDLAAHCLRNGQVDIHELT